LGSSETGFTGFTNGRIDGAVNAIGVLTGLGEGEQIYEEDEQ
jgi:hypothetical protein